MEDFSFGDIDKSDESMQEAESWASEEEQKTCKEDNEHHNNFSLSYFHEGKAGYMRDGCYLGGHKCRDCKKTLVEKYTKGNEANEYKATESKPVHACSCIKLGMKCEHVYCDPCFIPRLCECGKTKGSPRKRRGVAVYNVGPIPYSGY